MRVVAILLAFAAAFGLAAWWQSRRIDRLRRESELAQKLRDGELGETSSGIVPQGWGVVVVGRPSGAEPIGGERGEVEDAVEYEDATEARPDSAPASAATPPALDPASLADFELTVAPGHSLSEIAKEHYGTASGAVVGALARYNGLTDADRLTAGQRLLLPPIERLR
jgi:nucleoid-associated protein YgaU